MNKEETFNRVTKEQEHFFNASANSADDVLSTTIITDDAMPEPEDDNLRYMLVPLGVLLGILLLSALVFLMARNRRRLAHIYCKRKTVPSFTFDDSDSALEQGEDFDFDDPTECLLKGKLQIDNRHENYQTTQVTQMASGRSELRT